LFRTPGEQDREAVAFAQSVTGNGALNLRADRASGGIRLNWDTSSPLLNGATEGVVTIDDSGSRTQVRLTPEQLRSGSLEWQPKTRETEFEMRIENHQGRAATESIRVLDSQDPASESAVPSSQ
jgi:hypothetical protein